MPETLTIQRATLDNVAQILEHRRLMFLEEQVAGPEKVIASLPPFKLWLEENIPTEQYIGLMAVDGDVVAASAGLWKLPWPPGPINSSEGRAYILNVYTDPAYRRRGLARRLVSALIEEARRLNFSVIELHASSAGRPVYEGLGFKPTNQMRLMD